MIPSWNVGGPLLGLPPFISISTERHVSIPRTTESNIPSMTEAVKKLKTATMATGAMIDPTYSDSPVTFFMRKIKLKQFPTVMASFPSKMKILAKKLAKANLATCLT